MVIPGVGTVTHAASRWSQQWHGHSVVTASVQWSYSGSTCIRLALRHSVSTALVHGHFRVQEHGHFGQRRHFEKCRAFSAFARNACDRNARAMTADRVTVTECLLELMH